MPNIPLNSPWRFSAAAAQETLQRKGMSLNQVCAKVLDDGFSDISAVKKALQGKSHPSLPLAFSIACAMDVPMETLMERVRLPELSAGKRPS
ncbi:MAG: hypothetical protein EYC70_00315 [Planctomycetota bacterium]|nr:MAG: hypothetical protein EYC70_00315 [Planctomycetota bacterium]